MAFKYGLIVSSVAKMEAEWVELPALAILMIITTKTYHKLISGNCDQEGLLIAKRI